VLYCIFMDRPTLLLLPGLGADRRFFLPQQSLPISKEVIEWIEPESKLESLQHYSQRMAEHIGHRPGAYIGGASLGAMVALEVANQIGARGVFVIGGCRSHREISPLFRAVLYAGAVMPMRWIKPSLLLAPLALTLLEGLDRARTSLMMQMLREHSREHIRWSCRAILEWECCGDAPSMPIWTIHGSRDEVIPARHVRADQWVAQGHHLISLGQPDAVNHFLTKGIMIESAREVA
jgi:pimeloyl-ACP methyl ester carboxylesterase